MLGHASTVCAADWRINSTARVATDYNSNPRLRIEREESSTATVGELSARILRLTERSEITLQPKLYSSRNSQDALLDRDDRYLQAGFTYVTERTQWNATADYAYDTTLTSELELTGLVEGDRRHEGLTITAGPSYSLTERTTLGMQLYWNDNHYVDAQFTGLVDYDYGAASLFSSYALSDRTTFNLTARTGRLTVPDIPFADKRDDSLTIGWRYAAWTLWTVELSAGPSLAKSDAGTDDGWVFRADMQRRAERWTFTTSAGRDVTSTGVGGLSRRDQLSIGASRRLTERVATSVSIRSGRNRELLSRSGRGYELAYSRADLQLNWQLAEHWSLSAAVSGNMQKIDSQRHGADNQRASLSIVWNGPAHSL